MITSEWPTDEHPEWAPFIVRQVEFLRRRGIEVEVFHFVGRRQPANYLRAWRDAHALLNGKSFDLVHAQWGHSALMALPVKLPLVITYRGGDLQGIVGANGRYTTSGRLLRLISQSMAHLADEVIVVSDHLGRYLPKREYHVIPSGLNMSLFRPMPQQQARAQLGLLSDRRYVLFAASPNNPVKRYSLARAAMEKIERSCNAELLVATGVRPELMPVYMNACDVLVVTSRYEGSPNVVKEALACDLPVVSLDVGDVGQRIAYIEGCILCHDDDPLTIARALTEVLKRPGRISGRPAVQNLDEALLADSVISVYRKALDKKTVHRLSSTQPPEDDASK